MERDFLGLSLKEPLSVVKEEVNNDGCKEIGFNKGSGIEWPFSNKVTAIPQFMSFKVAQEDKTKKIVSDSLVSSGFMPFSAAGSPAEIQKSFNHDRQVGSHISLTPYSVQQDVHSLHRPHDLKTFPFTNEAITVSINNPFFKNHSTTLGQNLGAANMKQQLLGGIPVAAQHTILPTVGGITEPCVKTRGSPQLTIFYGGTVNVFDDISPEKAQAIMLLAGNGTTSAPTTTQPKVQVQTPSSKLATVDGVSMNKPANTLTCAGHSSPISVSSHTGSQSGSGSTSTEETMAAKTTGLATAPILKLESPKTANAVGSAAATTMASAGHSNLYAAIPQFRKASLASFLQKRKQRIVNAAPYTISKDSPDGSAPECDGLNLSVNPAGATRNGNCNATSAN